MAINAGYLLRIVVAVTCLALCGCTSYLRNKQLQELRRQAAPADKMLTALCKEAGEKIYRTVEDVDGLVLLNVRPRRVSVNVQQFEMSDPYGSDYEQEGYIEQFLWTSPREDGQSRSFNYVETMEGGKFFLYHLPEIPAGLSKLDAMTARAKRKLVRVEVATTSPRYGVEYQDISTPEQRQLWIAGSALRIKDLKTGEVIAERIGYMADLYQGRSDFPRLPWARAADTACPSFRRAAMSGIPSFVGQRAQTSRFVFKVLIPSSKIH